MSEPTLKEMEDAWTVKMAARHGAGHPKAGQRIFETDPHYRNEVTALRVSIEERKTAEVRRPQINADQLAWLERAQGARDKDGKRLTDNPVYAKNLQAARAKVYEGGDISGMRLSDKEGSTLGPAFAQPTAQQRQVASEQKTGGFGPHHSVHPISSAPIKTNPGN